MRQEEQTYHPSEHYVPPRSPLDVMDEFIKLYEPGQDSVNYVMALGRMYAKVPFLHFMQEHARFIEIARVEDSDQRVRLDYAAHDPNFLGGALMAIHANTYGANAMLKRRILSANPLDGLRSAPDCKEKYQVIQDCVDVMREWDEHGAQTIFDDQTDEFKDRLLEIAIMMYNDVPQPNGADMRFISGFMYSSQMIWTLAKGIGPPA